jgi:hypothetical protein
MASNHFATAALVGLLASLEGACTSRDVPHSYPRTSAAAPEAAPAEAAVVTRALQSEPPLPGTPAEGWAGLRDPNGAPPGASPHAGHGGHQHGAQPQPKAPTHDHSKHQQGAQPAQPPPTPDSDHGAEHDH